MQEDTAVNALSALAQGTRLAVFRLLVRCGPAGLAAGDIARALGVPHNTLSVHLGLLSQAGLLRSERRGRSILYSVDFRGTGELMRYLLEDCCQGAPEVCRPLARALESADGGANPATGAGAAGCCPPHRSDTV